jgi:signal transduction histidine kinase
MDEVRSALDSISYESHRAGEIVRNLRAMFKKDGQDSGPVDINRVIASVLSLMRIELQKHDISVRTELGHGLPPAFGHEVQLQQVLLNLIINAKEAMQTADVPRTLRIKSELNESGEVQVSVEDTGPGLPASDIDQIFQPMFTTKTRGMGMGLSICRRIIRAHGGRIWAAKSGAAGLIFCFALPARP